MVKRPVRGDGGAPTRSNPFGPQPIASVNGWRHRFASVFLIETEIDLGTEAHAAAAALRTLAVDGEQGRPVYSPKPKRTGEELRCS